MKEQIVQIAQMQLMSGGYDALNFASISEALNTSRANLHHHFKNKEGLACEAVRAYMNQKVMFLSEIANKHQSNFPGYFAELDQMFLGEIARTGQIHDCACDQLLRADDVPDALVDLSKDYFKLHVDIHANLIRESQQAGNMSKTMDAERLAYMTIIFMGGMVQTLRASKDIRAYAKKMRGSFYEWLAPYTIKKEVNDEQ